MFGVKYVKYDSDVISEHAQIHVICKWNKRWTQKPNKDTKPTTDSDKTALLLQ